MTESTAKRIVERLLDNLDDRSGFSVPFDDEGVMEEWKETWAGIVQEEACKENPND